MLCAGKDEERQAVRRSNTKPSVAALTMNPAVLTETVDNPDDRLRLSLHLLAIPRSVRRPRLLLAAALGRVTTGRDRPGLSIDQRHFGPATG